MHKYIRVRAAAWMPSAGRRTVHVKRVRNTLLQRQLRITLLQGSCAGNARTVHVRRVHAPTLPPGLHLSREAPPSLYLVHHDGLARPAHGRVDGATASRRRVNGREVGDDAVPAAG